MKKPWSEWTDEELADEAQTGQRGQGAVVEASRRLRAAIQRLDRLTTTLAKWLLAFTLVLVALAIAQLVAAFI